MNIEWRMPFFEHEFFYPFYLTVTRYGADILIANVQVQVIVGGLEYVLRVIEYKYGLQHRMSINDASNCLMKKRQRQIFYPKMRIPYGLITFRQICTGHVLLQHKQLCLSQGDYIF